MQWRGWTIQKKDLNSILHKNIHECPILDKTIQYTYQKTKMCNIKQRHCLIKKKNSVLKEWISFSRRHLDRIKFRYYMFDKWSIKHNALVKMMVLGQLPAEGICLSVCQSTQSPEVLVRLKKTNRSGLIMFLRYIINMQNVI